jgi:dihydrofolate synthase/folylpolyglutamate synthase
VAGAHALRAALAEEFPDAPRTLVVGLLREKDPVEMLDALDAGLVQRLVCCRPPSARARDADDLAAAAMELGLDRDQIDVIDDVGDAVQHAVATAASDAQVIVAGSLYVVGAARSALRSTDR